MSAPTVDPAISAIIPGAFGTLLIGAVVNCSLFGFELAQLYTYFRGQRMKLSDIEAARLRDKLFPATDRMAIRALVVFMFLVDCVATVNAGAMVYHFAIRNWGNVGVLAGASNTVPVYSITMAFSVICMHSFLIYRYIVLSKNWIIAGVLALLAATAFVGDMLATWSVIRYTTLAERFHLRPYAIVWLTSSATADVLIACLLIWELRRVESPLHQAESLIKRLVVNAVMTGAFPAILAIVTLATYLGSTTTNICLSFGFLMGRACTLTVLYNLNLGRQSAHFLSGAESKVTSAVPMETGIGADKSAMAADITHVVGRDDDDQHSLDDKHHAHAAV